VRRDRIFDAFYREFSNSALLVRVLGCVPQLHVIDLIADIWYWKKTMVMEMMMDE